MATKSFILEHEAKYEATVQLGFFESIVTNEHIQVLFTSIGFRNVVVEGDGEERRGTGVWNKPTQTVAMDAHITSVKKV